MEGGWGFFYAGRRRKRTISGNGGGKRSGWQERIKANPAETPFLPVLEGSKESCL